MRALITKLALSGAIVALGGTIGCTANVHDNTLDVHDNNANIDEAAVEFSTEVDVDNVQASASVRVTLEAESVFLIDPSSEPPADRVSVAGHFQFYLDNTSGEPLLITASKSVDVPIPAMVPAGAHTLICRIHKHDGTPTDATFEVDITVVASIETSVGADAGL